MQLFSESEIGRSRYPDSVNKRSISEGLEFQDFVLKTMQNRMGLSLSIYGSRTYQFMEGESVQGVEIKLDQLWTGQKKRLSIEVAEKSRAANGYYVWSGIFRADNTWLYIQGNASGFYVFIKHQLVRLYMERTAAGQAAITPARYKSVNPELPWNSNRTPKQLEVSIKPTIISYYLPVEWANVYGFFVSG